MSGLTYIEWHLGLPLQTELRMLTVNDVKVVGSGVIRVEDINYTKKQDVESYEGREILRGVSLILYTQG